MQLWDNYDEIIKTTIEPWSATLPAWVNKVESGRIQSEKCILDNEILMKY